MQSLQQRMEQNKPDKEGGWECRGSAVCLPMQPGNLAEMKLAPFTRERTVHTAAMLPGVPANAPPPRSFWQRLDLPDIPRVIPNEDLFPEKEFCGMTFKSEGSSLVLTCTRERRLHPFTQGSPLQRS